MIAVALALLKLKIYLEVDEVKKDIHKNVSSRASKIHLTLAEGIMKSEITSNIIQGIKSSENFKISALSGIGRNQALHAVVHVGPHKMASSTL